MGRLHLARNYISQGPLQLGMATCQFLTKGMPVGAKDAGEKCRTQLSQFQKMKDVPSASCSHCPGTPWALLFLTAMLPGLSPPVIVLRVPTLLQ